MKDVESVSTNKDHTIVMKKDGQVLAWGLGQLFSNHLRGPIEKPINMTDELQRINERKIKTVKAGYRFTVIVRDNDEIDIVGSETIVEVPKESFTKPIFDVTCSKFEENAVFLVDE